MSTKADAVTNTEEDASSVVVVNNSDAASETSQKDSDKDAKSDAGDDDTKKDEKKEEEEEKIPFGMLADKVFLYAKFDKDGNQSWTDKIPEDVEEAAENEGTQKFAIIVRKKKPKVADSSKPLEIDSIIIQSPHLKEILKTVLSGYPGIIVDVARFTLNAPFQPMVHRWEEFTAAAKDTSHDEVAKAHVELLHKVLSDELGEIIQLRKDYLRNKAAPFEHLWTIFQPGCTVLGSKYGHPSALEMRSGGYRKTQCGDVYSLSCRYLEWDGDRLGWSDLSQTISAYAGTVPFKSLNCQPFDHHPDKESITKVLLDRGRRWRLFAGYRYKAYKGVGIYHVDADTTRREEIDSRVVIDGTNWEKNNYDHQVYISSIFDVNHETNDLRDISEEEAAKQYPLTDEQLIMTSPVVRGYALKNKRWMEFYVDNVTDIKFDDQAFQSLVLSQDHKELVLAFAESQIKYKNAFDDIISGKGKGIIMLLSGGPGIGKTLTAESVAEHMKVPLYSMSGGDLGAAASEVEENLGQVLHMVAHWNAVLLLDECDVFLEERSPHDIERNRIVSIFLRTLEYYEGILFLTTNRVRNIDPAFQSRIHISLDYPPLDTAARASVWRGFLGRAVSLPGSGRAAHDVTELDIEDLSALDLNGRQIKNVLKTANLLACHKEEVMGMSHLRTVLKVKGHSL